MQETLHRLLADDSRRLDSFEAESVELVVTSPPYPMIAMWDELFTQLDPEIGRLLASGDGVAAYAAMHRALDPVWSELYRVLRPGCLLCLNVGDAARSLAGRFRLYSNHSRLLERLIELGFQSLPLILWRKPTNAPTKFMGSGMLPAGAYVTLEHEYILLLRKGGKREFRTDDERARRRRSAYFWEERNSWFSDRWELRGRRQRLNPAEQKEGAEAGRGRSASFPFELAYRLICMFSAEADLVLDPFLGTGTTLHAAIAAGRSSVGIELDPLLVAECEKGLPLLGPELNLFLAERLARHVEFAAKATAADGRSLVFRYRNAHHGVPVMTSQEVDLRIDLVDSIRPVATSTYAASYCPVPKKALAESSDPTSLGHIS